jgi:triosephosphate isomerase
MNRRNVTGIAITMWPKLLDHYTPIICVGEDESVRNNGQHFSFVKSQLKQGLPYLEFGENVRDIVIAYEPIWAIGSGKTATLAQIEEMAKEIHTIVGNFYQHFSQLRITVLYGGSVKPDNAKEILGLPSVDGLLIGGASLVPKNMEQILSFC